MSTAQTRTSVQEEQRKSHRHYNIAKADVEKKCQLYPGYQLVVEGVKEVLQSLEASRSTSAFDAVYAHRAPSRPAAASE